MSASTEHVILIAMHVSAPNRQAAQNWLLTHLPSTRDPKNFGALDSWWIAEDDRVDGSDNGSAVFVKAGQTEEAYDVLEAAGLTGEAHYATWTPRARAQRAAFERDYAADEDAPE